MKHRSAVYFSLPYTLLNHWCVGPLMSILCAINDLTFTHFRFSPKALLLLLVPAHYCDTFVSLMSYFQYNVAISPHRTIYQALSLWAIFKLELPIHSTSKSLSQETIYQNSHSISVWWCLWAAWDGQFKHFKRFLQFSSKETGQRAVSQINRASNLAPWADKTWDQWQVHTITRPCISELFGTALEYEKSLMPVPYGPVSL